MKEIFDRIDNTEQSAQLEIPDIDLYVDQITTLFEKNLSNERRFEKDKLLTKSMINNYSKEGVLKSIKGKKYSKAHIMMMQMIYSLKKTLSIIDIKSLLGEIENDISLDKHTYNADKIQNLYSLNDKNRKLSNTLIKDFIAMSKEKIELTGNDSEDMLLLTLYLADASSQLKQSSEAIIDSTIKE